MRACTVSKITGKSSRRLDLMAPLSRSNILPFSSSIQVRSKGNAVGERWTRLLLSDDKCETFSKGGD